MTNSLVATEGLFTDLAELSVFVGRIKLQVTASLCIAGTIIDLVSCLATGGP